MLRRWFRLVATRRRFWFDATRGTQVAGKPPAPAFPSGPPGRCLMAVPAARFQALGHLRVLQGLLQQAEVAGGAGPCLPGPKRWNAPCLFGRGSPQAVEHGFPELAGLGGAPLRALLSCVRPVAGSSSVNGNGLGWFLPFLLPFRPVG